MKVSQIISQNGCIIAHVLSRPTSTYAGKAYKLMSDRTKTSDFTTTSTILVGSDLTPFQIHTSLLTSKSSYFRAALNGPLVFIESETNSITLDDVSV